MQNLGGNGSGRRNGDYYLGDGGRNVRSLVDPSLMDQWMCMCIFCYQTFNSGSALGGHQIANRFQAGGSRTHHDRVSRNHHHHRNRHQHSQFMPPSAGDLVPLQPVPRCYCRGMPLMPFIPPPMNYQHPYWRTHNVSSNSLISHPISMAPPISYPYAGPIIVPSVETPVTYQNSTAGSSSSRVGRATVTDIADHVAVANEEEELDLELRLGIGRRN
ncbi:uncharacterized protein LOC124929679 [Impatiens glandulifera]|uniref:uncharacterized protein LOC124929679 n=1 Tax=Impatiens glandulifera TaxID=253017 RepID=UPI001FB09770|nr:uncharacterized protein LOC124929679 [Impatiens glandulifera]